MAGDGADGGSTNSAGRSSPTVIGSPVLRPRAQVEQRIRAAIMSGDLPVGSRLPSEAALSQQFAVSRTTIREALRSLSAQNLIKKVPGAGGGSFVQAVNLQSFRENLTQSMRNLVQIGSVDFEEISLMRQHLEIPAARLAATRRSDEDLARLREIIAREREISNDDPAVPQLDKDFHESIASASGNRLLASFVGGLHRETEPVHYLDLSPDVGRATVRQHQEIYRAIASRNPDAAEKAVIDHLTFLREHLRDHARGDVGP